MQTSDFALVFKGKGALLLINHGVSAVWVEESELWIEPGTLVMPHGCWTFPSRGTSCIWFFLIGH